MLNNLFCDFNTPDSWFVLTFLLGSFVLGLLLGWLLWGEKLKRALADIVAANAATASLQADNIGLKDKNTLIEADLQKTNKDIEDLRVAFVNIQNEKGQTDSELLNVKDMFAKVSTDAGDLRIQLQNLENQNIQLKADLSDATTPLAIAAIVDEQPAAEGLDNKIELEILDTTNGSETDLVLTGDIEATVEEVAEEEIQVEAEAISEEAKIEEEVAVEEAAVQEAMTEEVAATDEPKAEKEVIADADEALITLLATDGAIEEVVAEPKKISVDTDIATTPQEEVVIPATPPKGIIYNDLKAVEGIGPKVELLLLKHNITTWAQLAEKSQEDLKQILIDGGERFRILNPGTWPRQAELLSKEQWDEFKSYTAYLVAGVDPGNTASRKAEDDKRVQLVISPKGWRSDDLKIIEGIGPKIEQLLKSAGILFWGQLAETTPTRLREILAGGGDRFQMHDPTTWPDQAQLLYNQEWDKYDEFVKFLNRGKTPS